MATATETATETTKGVKVTCILCGNEESTVSVDLGDVHKFYCSACESEFSPEDVREHLAQWGKALEWIDLAPAKG
jgi:transposase-like protein